MLAAPGGCGDSEGDEGVLSSSASASASVSAFANTTVLDVSSGQEAESGSAARILTGIALSILAVSCVVGNMFVVLAVSLVRKLKQPANLLVVNLAISDIAIALFVMPPAASREVLGFWALGDTMCSIYIVCDVALCSASILNLCMISVDRYLSITSPFGYGAKRHEVRICALIATVWLSALLISVPPLFLWDTTQKPDTCEYSSDLGYQIYAMVASFFAPSAIIVFIYAKIFLLVRKISVNDKRVKPATAAMVQSLGSLMQSSISLAARHRTMDGNIARPNRAAPAQPAALPQSTSQPLVTLLPVDSNCNLYESRNYSFVNNDHHVNSRCESYSSSTFAMQQNLKTKLIKKSESKAIITLGALLGAFFLSWTPFFVLQLIKTVCGDRCYVPARLESVFLWLGYVNSFVNPPLYSVFNRDFRTPFMEFLKCRCATINDKLRMQQCYEQFGIPAIKLVQYRAGTNCGNPTSLTSHRQDRPPLADSDNRTTHKSTPTAV